MQGQKVSAKPKIGTRNCKQFRENQSFEPELQKTSGKPKKPKKPKFQTLELQKTSGKPKKHIFQTLLGKMGCLKK